MADREITHVTIADVRKAGHCVAGAKTWFNLHGLNFNLFLKEGISVEAFLGTGDALAEQIVEHMRERR